MSAVPVSQLNVSIPWQAQFLSVLPAVQTHARIRFRRLTSERPEEAVQESVAAACVNYQLAAAQGKLQAVRPGALADFAVRHVRTGRHVGGSQDTAHDLLSPTARTRHGLRLVSCSALDSSEETWKPGAEAGRRAGVADLAAFRLDFEQWLKQLDGRDRGIVAALASGCGSGEVAGRFGLSVGRVSQLRREYERRCSRERRRRRRRRGRVEDWEKVGPPSGPTFLAMISTDHGGVALVT